MSADRGAVDRSEADRLAAERIAGVGKLAWLPAGRRAVSLAALWITIQLYDHANTIC